jgi:hypothetical protein
MEDGGSRMEDRGLRGSSRRWVVWGALEVGRWGVRTFSVLDRVGPGSAKRPRWRGGDAGSTSWGGPRPFVAHATGHSADRTSVGGRYSGCRQGRAISWRRGALRWGKFSFHQSPLVFQALRFNTGRQQADRHEILLWDARQTWPMRLATDRPGARQSRSGSAGGRHPLSSLLERVVDTA